MRRYSAAASDAFGLAVLRGRINLRRFRGDERTGALVMLVPVVIMVVVMAVMMIAAVMLIVGAALGIERRFDRRQPRAEPAKHLLDDVIAPDAQPFADDLDVDVTIADVPSKPRQVVAIDSGDFNEGLRL